MEGIEDSSTEYLRLLIEINNFKNRNTSILICIQSPVNNNNSGSFPSRAYEFPNHKLSFLRTLYGEIFIFLY